MDFNKFPQALAFLDLETDGLPVHNDYSMVNVLEIAVIVTDFDLQPMAGMSTVIKLTKEAVARLKANEFVLNMHKANGLIKESAASTVTLAEAEAEVIAVFKEATTFDKGEFMIAGSGVASFDFPLIKQQMPELASWFAYYPFDMGIQRRVTKILAGRDVVNPSNPTTGDGAAHRALNDVNWAIADAGKYREWLRSIV